MELVKEVDYTKKLQELTTKKEQLATRITKIQVIKEQTEKALEDLKIEMVQIGTTPETIEEDYKKTEAEVKVQLEAYEKHLQEVEAQVVESEEALKQV